MSDDLITASSTASGMFRLKKPDSVQLSIPDAPDGISRDSLKDALDNLSSARSDLVIVDVRSVEEYNMGRIPGAISIPFDTFTMEASRELAGRYREKPGTRFVFVSMQSPDLDQAAALQFMEACAESGTIQEVFVLQGGMLSWVRAYAKRTEHYDTEKWTPILRAMKSPVLKPQSDIAF